MPTQSTNLKCQSKMPCPHTDQIHTGHESPQRVFVYGTLMTGERNAALTKHPTEHLTEHHGDGDLNNSKILRPERQKAYVCGFCLYDLVPENYPALIRKAGAVVWGELLSYDTYEAQEWASVLSALDDLEAVHTTPPLYTRHHVQVHISAHTNPDNTNQTNTSPEQATFLAWVYIYARPKRLLQHGAHLLVDGNWYNRNRRTT